MVILKGLSNCAAPCHRLAAWPRVAVVGSALLWSLLFALAAVRFVSVLDLTAHLLLCTFAVVVVWLTFIRFDSGNKRCWQIANVNLMGMILFYVLT